MRSYKIESYVPEASFLSGKDARFCRAAFEDCFVLDFHNGPAIIASCRGTEQIEASMADTAALLTLFDGKNEFLILPSSRGTLLIYPAWPRLELALAFLLKEDVEEVEKSYQNAKRYAFSQIFETDGDTEINQRLNLEAKLCALEFYRDRLFGNKRETNVVAQILMISNLTGCKLHEMSLSRTNVTLDEREMEMLSAYLCCVFMTMRRYNGKVTTTDKTEENTDFLTHVPQEYGLQIQQSVREIATRPTNFDLPSQADISSFATHPAFKNYKIEESGGVFRLCLSLKQKTFLSSIAARGNGQELILTLFPLK